MYSSDKSEYDQHRPGAGFQKTIEPLMLKANVSLYLCGHMHIYERVHAVENGTVVQAATSVYHNPGAPVHVVQVWASALCACVCLCVSVCGD